MKKILFILALMLSLTSAVYANPTPVKFIYMHGADQLSYGGQPAFEAWMNGLHPALKKNFEKSEFIKSHLLKGAYIDEKPDMIYWAGRLKDNKEFLKSSLDKSAKSSLLVPQFARATIARVVHDAVWLQKSRNMTPILNELNEKVIANANKGEKTFLVGYSAGTFITLNYMFMKGTVLDLADLFQHFKGKYGITDKDIAFAKKYVPEKTCMSALKDAKLFYFDDIGYVFDENAANRLTAMKKIKTQTKLSCAPKDNVIGVLNFGAPIVTFYSELIGQDRLQRYVINKSFKYMVENGQVYLSVNYNKDPIAMATPDFTFNEIKQNISPDLKNGDGFFYGTFISGGKNIAEGHLRYWHIPESYAKAVAKSYETGYKYFYGK